MFRTPTIKVIFERGKPASKGSIKQTIVHSNQQGQWKKKKPDDTRNNVANHGEDIYKILPKEKYIIVPKKIKNGRCYYDPAYYLEINIKEITKKELRALRLKI